MPEEPRRDEQRFYRYPHNRVVAILDDDGAVEAALASLGQAGVDVAEATVLTGPDGAQSLDASGRGHGLQGRLVRLLQRGAFESETLAAHEQALHAGGTVLYVPVGDRPQRDRVVQALRAAGGHHLLHFRRWSIEAL